MFSSPLSHQYCDFGNFSCQQCKYIQTAYLGIIRYDLCRKSSKRAPPLEVNKKIEPHPSSIYDIYQSFGTTKHKKWADWQYGTWRAWDCPFDSARTPRQRPSRGCLIHSFLISFALFPQQLRYECSQNLDFRWSAYFEGRAPIGKKGNILVFEVHMHGRNLQGKLWLLLAAFIVQRKLAQPIQYGDWRSTIRKKIKKRQSGGRVNGSGMKTDTRA